MKVLDFIYVNIDIYFYCRMRNIPNWLTPLSPLCTGPARDLWFADYMILFTQYQSLLLIRCIFYAYH